MRAFGARARLVRAAQLYRANRALCPMCEYQFPDVERPRCPECGWSNETVLPRAVWSDTHIPFLLGLCAMCATVTGVSVWAWESLAWSRMAWSLFSEVWFLVFLLTGLVAAGLLVAEFVAWVFPRLRERRTRSPEGAAGASPGHDDADE